MFVWYFKEENTLRFWRLCGRIEKTRRKETAVTLQQLRYVTAVAGADTISFAIAGSGVALLDAEQVEDGPMNAGPWKPWTVNQSSAVVRALTGSM